MSVQFKLAFGSRRHRNRNSHTHQNLLDSAFANYTHYYIREKIDTLNKQRHTYISSSCNIDFAFFSLSISNVCCLFFLTCGQSWIKLLRMQTGQHHWQKIALSNIFFVCGEIDKQSNGKRKKFHRVLLMIYLRGNIILME